MIQYVTYFTSVAIQIVFDNTNKDNTSKNFLDSFIEAGSFERRTDVFVTGIFSLDCSIP